MSPFDNDKNTRIIQFVRDFIFRSTRYREPHIELAKKSRELYENWQPSGRSAIQRANLKLPFGFTVIETQLPQLVEFFLRDNIIVTFEGTTLQASEVEEAITDFHNKQFESMNFFVKFPAFIKSMLLDGTAIAKIPYRYREGQIVKRFQEVDPITGEVKLRKELVTEVLYDAPDFEVVPIYDFFPDWSVKVAGDIQSMRGLVHRTWSTLQSLKSSAVYHNLDELSLSVEKKGNHAWAPPYFAPDDEQRFNRLNDNLEEGIKHEGKIELWEYWGLFDPNDDGKFEEYIITIANGDVVIRFEPNFYDYKFKPFIATPNFIRDNEFYGIPELIVIRSLIKEANALRNARLDNVNLSVNPMFLVDKNAGIDLRSLYSRPGGVILANDINGIKALQLPDPSLSSISESATIQQDIQSTTSMVNAAPYVSQLGRTYGRTAAGVEFLRSLSAGKVNLKARYIAWAALQPMAKLMLLTNRQFVTQDVWLRQADPTKENPFLKLSPSSFSYDFNIIPKTDIDTGGVEGEFQKMQLVSQVAQVFENTQPGTIKADVLLESLLRPLLGRRVKKFVRDEQERAAIQAQSLAVQQAINAEQGKKAPQPTAPMEIPNV